MMKRLNDNWLTEGLIDFEYKKYILLAYLQNAKKDFGECKLYPLFSDLIFHYKNLLKIKENKGLIYESFPKQISRADFEKLQITYKTIVQDDEMMKELEELVLFALPKFKGVLENGKEIYELIESNLEINQVGITPLYLEEGYIFIDEYQVKETHVYRYQVSVFESMDERFRGINMRYLESVRRGLGQTLESLKIGLVRRFQQLPNPAAYQVVSKVKCPLNETLLPIAKRAVVKFIYSEAA